jgi:hypothetical protein
VSNFYLFFWPQNQHRDRKKPFPNHESVVFEISLQFIPSITTMNFFEMLFHSTNKGPDIAAMGAIIGAGISYLVSRGRKLVSSKIFRFILPGQNGKNFRLTGPFKRAIKNTIKIPYKGVILCLPKSMQTIRSASQS